MVRLHSDQLVAEVRLYLDQHQVRPQTGLVREVLCLYQAQESVRLLMASAQVDPPALYQGPAHQPPLSPASTA